MLGEICLVTVTTDNILFNAADRSPLLTLGQGRFKWVPKLKRGRLWGRAGSG